MRDRGEHGARLNEAAVRAEGVIQEQAADLARMTDRAIKAENSLVSATAANDRLCREHLELQADFAREREQTSTIRRDVLGLIEHQANDDGLWFVARTASEAYLQAGLRRLHAAVEAVVRALDAKEPV